MSNRIRSSSPRKRSSVRSSLFTLGALSVASAPAAWASFTVTFVAPFHGAPCTEYSAWESFTQPNLLPNSPDDPTTTSPDSAVLQLTPGGVITSAGNLDNLTSPPSYRITDTVPADLQAIFLQVSTNLNPFDWNNVQLHYLDTGGGLHTFLPNTSTYLVHSMGHDERLMFWDFTGVVDDIRSYWIDVPTTNSFSTLDAVKLDTRFACGPGVAYCAGDGLSSPPTTPCPCANVGAAGNGCASSFNAAGAHIDAAGAVASDTVVLTGSGMQASGICVFLQGDLVDPNAYAFGDGITCTGGALTRLRAVALSGGSASFPVAPETITLSQRGGVTVGSGAVRSYTVFYRNAAAAFCPPFTFNVANSYQITW